MTQHIVAFTTEEQHAIEWLKVMAGLNPNADPLQSREAVILNLIERLVASIEQPPPVVHPTEPQ